ncbi:MAG: hypothetical protein KAY24_13905 [Candidatus Eisenbacteria sp.]|nr:hypothetical protein [Candidatus Eisenbacteria bacterium]
MDEHKPPVWTEDIEFTFHLLNMLISGYQGHYTWRNVLGQLGFDVTEMHPLEDLQEVIDVLKEHRQELPRGNPLFRKGQALSPDAEVVVGFMDLLKKGLQSVVNALTRSLELLEQGPHINAARYTVACIARHAYVHEHYVHGLVRYGEVFGLEEVADRWRQHTLTCAEETNMANAFFARMMENPELDGDFRLKLIERAKMLPVVFSRHLDDLNSVDSHLERMMGPEGN